MSSLGSQAFYDVMVDVYVSLLICNKYIPIFVLRYKHVELNSMSLNYNIICCFNSCFQTPQLFWANSVEPLLQFQLYLPPITCASHFTVMTRPNIKVFFSSTVLFR